jgi:outer membrane biosynthesis protein TonB
MSRLTGNEVRGLMEAYQAVYAPQELTEEQVWEEVEEWVNALVEEGYDLSDYTWEEMYESYITEVVPLAIPAAMAAAPYVLPALGAAAYTAKELMNRRKTKNTPEQERFLSTGSFATKKLTKKELDQRRKDAKDRKAEREAAAKEPAKNPKPEEKITSVSAPSVQQTPSRGGRIGQNLGRAYGQPSGVSSGASSSGGGGSATGGSGGRRPKPEGPNWAQRQLTDIQRGRTQEKGAGTAERFGRVIGSGEKITKGSAEWAAKNLIAKPLGAIAGAGLVGTAGYGAYKGSEALIKKFGPGVLKKGKEILNLPTSTPPPPKPQRGTPPKVEDAKKESFYASGGIIEEKVDPIEIYNRQGNLQKVTPGKGYPITKGGKRGYVVYDTSGKPKFTEYPTQPIPAQQPPAQDNGQRKSGESLEDFARRQSAELQKDYPTTPAQTQPPATTTPAPAQPPATTTPAPAQPPATTTPAPAATTQRPAEPKVSPSKPAQTGDRTKDLTTWASTNKGMINKVGTPQQKEILSAAEKGTAMPAPRPISKDIEDIKRMQTDSRARQGVKESYDAYDLVLEYLLSQGHADTLEEANYVMLEMDAEMIGDIVDIFYK